MHPNDMSVWPEIACQREHGEHEAMLVDVKLGGQTGYADYAPIPARLTRNFEMLVFNWRTYASDGPYCPGRDVVSEAIAIQGVWEPLETIAILSVLTSKPGLVKDCGAQIGWFSLLAASCGCDVAAVEADAEPLRLLRVSAERNGWGAPIWTNHLRIDATTPPEPAVSWRLVKIDVEGAEFDAIRVLRPALEAGKVDHILMECSPVFAEGYGMLVHGIVDLGYEAYAFPDKATPPARFELPEHDLIPLGGDAAATVSAWHQESVWLRRAGAAW